MTDSAVETVLAIMAEYDMSVEEAACVLALDISANEQQEQSMQILNNFVDTLDDDIPHSALISSLTSMLSSVARKIAMSRAEELNRDPEEELEILASVLSLRLMLTIHSGQQVSLDKSHMN